MIGARAAQILTEVTNRVPYGGPRHALVMRALAFLRRKIVDLANDPLVEFDLHGTRMTVPLSHELPLILKVHPQYSMNVARLTEYIHAKYPEASVVDIGGNVGDTVATIRSVVDVSVLTIEGDERFHDILCANMGHMGDRVVVEHAFIGEHEGSLDGSLVREHGSAYFEEGAGGTVRVNTLREVLRRHPDFGSPKLLKIDTDGYDARIIRAERELLAELHPVVFFEYSPYWLERVGDTGLDVFGVLSQAGYRHALVYENTGDYLCTIRLDDEIACGDIDAFYRGRGGHRYADVCAFHAVDDDLWRTARDGELDHFRTVRPGP